MAYWETLKEALREVVKTNGNQEITGANMQVILLSLINTIGAHHQYVGVARPSTLPPSTDARVFYIAYEKGSYPNFRLYVDDNEACCIFRSTEDGGWEKDVLGYGSTPDINDDTVKFIDRGTWTEGEAYYCRELNPATGQYEVSFVWYYGCKWRCQRTGTTEEPRWNATDWLMVEGNPDFSVDFAEPEQLYDLDNFYMRLAIVATLYNRDITEDIADEDFVWSRYSEDADGNERTQDDALWTAKHASGGRAIVCTLDDLGVGLSSGFPRVVRFTCTVTLRDGAKTALYEDSATMAFNN
jgi:hypothetical protein